MMTDLQAGEIPGKNRMRYLFTKKRKQYLFVLDENQEPVIVGVLYKPQYFWDWCTEQAQEMAQIMHAHYTGKNIEVKPTQRLQAEDYARPPGRAGSTRRPRD